MLALIAAVLFIIAALSRAFEWSGHAGDSLMWAFFGFAAWALHSAYAVAAPRSSKPSA